jgi:acylphosphatase
VKKHFSLIIYGKVQGVGFRYRAKEFADSISVRGYARNMRDGSVQMDIEGEEDDVIKFILWCESGIDLAAVQQLDRTEGPVQGYREFQIY